VNFSRLLNDTVSILKPDGATSPTLKAAISKNQITLENVFLIEPGDLVVRTMSNGGTETFRVIDPGFKEKFHAIPAHYQMQVEKLGLPEAKAAVKSITYNIHGNNARVNLHSVDASTNVVQADTRHSVHIAAIRAGVQSTALSDTEKGDAQDIINAIEQGIQSGVAKKAVVRALLQALPELPATQSSLAAIKELY
tara:strand:+ start:14362 stop:14946 length:585 start_codon:yes stop_codon:yes gene_type:complete